MKLSEIIGHFAMKERRDAVVEAVSVRLAALEATELDSIIERGATRILIASDVALLDCDFADDNTERFKIEVMPWDAVPVPWIVYVGFLPWTDDRIDATFSMQLKPRFSTMYPASEKTVAEDFYRTLLRRRRVA